MCVQDSFCRDSFLFYKKPIGSTCTGYVALPPGDEIALQGTVERVGPVAVAIDAGEQSFQLYESGVYDEPDCTDDVNHAVLVVGYGTENSQDYWIVKNR